MPALVGNASFYIYEMRCNDIIDKVKFKCPKLQHSSKILYSRKLSRPITFALFVIFEIRENKICEIINNMVQNG